MVQFFDLLTASADSNFPSEPSSATRRAPRNFDTDEELVVAAYSTIREHRAIRAPGTGGIDSRSVPLLALSIEAHLILAMDPITRKIVGQIDGVRSVEQITVASKVAKSVVSVVLWDLVEAKLIVLTESIARGA